MIPAIRLLPLRGPKKGFGCKVPKQHIFKAPNMHIKGFWAPKSCPKNNFQGTRRAFRMFWAPKSPKNNFQGPKTCFEGLWGARAIRSLVPPSPSLWGAAPNFHFRARKHVLRDVGARKQSGTLAPPDPPLRRSPQFLFLVPNA